VITRRSKWLGLQSAYANHDLSPASFQATARCRERRSQAIAAGSPVLGGTQRLTRTSGLVLRSHRVLYLPEPFSLSLVSCPALASPGPRSRGACSVTAGQLSTDCPRPARSGLWGARGRSEPGIQNSRRKVQNWPHIDRPERVSTPWLGHNYQCDSPKKRNFWLVLFAITFNIHVTINTLNAM
jgi:hypothetical protein